MPINDPVPSPGQIPDAPTDLPVTSQPPTIFDDNAQDFVNYIGVLVPAQQSNTTYVYQRALQCKALAEFAQQEAEAATTNGAAQVALAQGFAEDAEAAASVATATANFAPGVTWSAGSYAAGVAVIHNNKIWVSEVSTSEEPGTGTDWFDFTDSISGGTIVTGNTDTTGSRITNVAWLRHRGVGTGLDASYLNLSTPNNCINLGVVSGLIDGNAIGISDLSAGSFGSLTLTSSGTDASVAGAVNLQFQRGGELWIRSSVNASNWTDWRKPAAESLNFATAPVQVFNSGDQDGSGNIAVTLDASQHNFWLLDFNGSPLPSTSGTYQLNMTNLPTSETELGYAFHVRVKRAGRKGLAFSASGITFSWVATPEFGAGVSNWELIAGHWTPAEPGIVYLSIVDGR